MPPVTGAQVAADGLSYIGHVQYVSGGAPGAGPPGHADPTDCSGWVDKVEGIDFGLPIPGHPAGTWRGADHGPVVMDWATWNGCTTLPAGQRPSAGDLCIWPGWGNFAHIGIATGPAQMVSCLNPELGVRQTGIEGNGPIPDRFLIFRRVNDTTPGGTVVGGPVPGRSAPAAARYALLGLAAPLAGIALVLGGAAIAGTLGAVIIGYVLVRAVSGSRSG